MRTTISIDIPLLSKIKEIGRREHKTFTRVVQELLILGIGLRSKRPEAASPFGHWHSKKMAALVDYTDKDVLYKMLDQRP